MTKEQILEWLDKNVRGFTQKDFELFKKFYEETTKELQEENKKIFNDWLEACNKYGEVNLKLTKAKEIIKNLMAFAEIDDREYEKEYKEAEQFLKE